MAGLGLVLWLHFSSLAEDRGARFGHGVCANRFRDLEAIWKIKLASCDFLLAGRSGRDPVAFLGDFRAKHDRKNPVDAFLNGTAGASFCFF